MLFSFFICFVWEGSDFLAEAFLLTLTGGPEISFFAEFFFDFESLAAVFDADASAVSVSAFLDFGLDSGGW